MSTPETASVQRWAVLVVGAALWYTVAVLMVGDQVSRLASTVHPASTRVVHSRCACEPLRAFQP
jgi:hypothetical protein